MFPGLWLKAEVAINKENEHKQKKLFRLTKKKKKKTHPSHWHVIKKDI